MKILKIICIILSYVLIAAHFLRAGNLTLALGLALFPAILFIRHRFSEWLIRAGLIFSLVVWLKTLFWLWKIYQIHHLPFTRPALILGAVILFTFSTLILTVAGHKKDT